MSPKELLNLLAEIVLFVMIGLFVEVVFFEVIIPMYLSLHVPVLYQALDWLILIVVIVGITRQQVAHARARGFSFIFGVSVLAIYVHDWYSVVVMITAGIFLYISLKSKKSS